MSTETETEAPTRQDDNITEWREATQLAESFFPGAMSGAQALAMVEAAVTARGYTPDNTLYAQSICPDEINHANGDVPHLFSSFFEECFHLGGLAGIPFTGKTGFGAFSHHVPDEGHCFILMAPHVGVSASHKLGSYTRLGQHGKEGAACGAAVGAWKHCCINHETPCLVANYADYQMTYIIHETHKRRDAILAKTDECDRQAELVKQTWEIGKHMLDSIISTDFGCDKSTLLVLTGIQINMPSPHKDYFQPLTFDLHRKDGTVIDLLPETFGYE